MSNKHIIDWKNTLPLYITAFDFDNNKLIVDPSVFQQDLDDRIKHNTKIILSVIRKDTDMQRYIEARELIYFTVEDVDYNNNIITLQENINELSGIYAYLPFLFVGGYLYTYNFDNILTFIQKQIIVDDETSLETTQIIGNYDAIGYIEPPSPTNPILTTPFKIGVSEIIDFTTPEYADFDKVISIYINDPSRIKCTIIKEKVDTEPHISGGYKITWEEYIVQYNNLTQQWEWQLVIDNSNDIIYRNGISGYIDLSTVTASSQAEEHSYMSIQTLSEHISSFQGLTKFRIMFLGDSIYSKFQSIVIDYGEIETEIQLVKIYGYLINTQGMPLSNKILYLSATPRQTYNRTIISTESIKTYTDNKGYFEFTVLPNTEYNLIIPTIGEEIIINVQNESLDVSEIISSYIRHYLF